VHTEAGPIGDKEHKLFYSRKDDRFYIAVVTQTTKEVMTILHGWQHRSCYKKITAEQFEKAKALIPEPNTNSATEAKDEPPPATFLVKVSYGEDQRVSNLFKSISGDYEYDIKTFAEDRMVNIRVANELSSQGYAGNVNGITIRLGSRGDPVIYDWDGHDLIPTKEY